MLLRLTLILLLCAGTLKAAGESARGIAIIRLIKLEHKGMITKSYEGIADRAGYDGGEKCDESNYQCFNPTLDTFDLSIRDTPQNKNLINFMLSNLEKEMIIEYQVHRIAAFSLSSRTEVLAAFPQQEILPDNIDRVFKTPKTGDKSSFDIFGRVLRLEKRGLTVKSWEGIYLDRKRRKVHPFSLSNEAMAQHLLKLIRYQPEYHMGVSVHYFATVRETPYDIFEINYSGPTGRL